MIGIVSLFVFQWVSDGSGGNPVRFEDPNMFAPQGANPKELNQKFKEVLSFRKALLDLTVFYISERALKQYRNFLTS